MLEKGSFFQGQLILTILIIKLKISIFNFISGSLQLQICVDLVRLPINKGIQIKKTFGNVGNLRGFEPSLLRIQCTFHCRNKFQWIFTLSIFMFTRTDFFPGIPGFLYFCLFWFFPTEVSKNFFSCKYHNRHQNFLDNIRISSGRLDFFIETHSRAISRTIYNVSVFFMPAKLLTK